jgi:hypothetical protein
VRRLIVLLVISLVGAAALGLSSFSTGLNVNGTVVSGKTFRVELAAIATTPNLECYLTALDPVNFTPGAGGASLPTSGAAAWSNLRIEGLAISQAVRQQFRHVTSASELASSKVSLEAELTSAVATLAAQQAAQGSSYQCPGTAAQALAAMPDEMRSAEIQAQADSLFLVSQLNATIPLNVASLKAYFAAHASSYDTLCVSVAVVSPTEVSAFAKAQAAGETVATLAKQFSVDKTSAAKGGAYGCFSPSSSSYASVRADVGTTALNSFPTTPQSVTLGGTNYALYVAPTSRTASTFAQASGMVLADVKNLNATSANTVKQNILYHAAISVDPAFGRWALSTNGPTVFPPALPASTDVASVTPLSSHTTATYK